MQFYYKQMFTYEQVADLLEKGYAVDGTQGGLILGRSHDEGGVFFLQDFGYCYQLLGEVEGFEYIFNIAITYLTRNNFDDWNDYTRDREDPFEEYIPNSSIRVIDTRLPANEKYEAKFILLEGRGNQNIINKHSTKKNLKIIDEVNRNYTYEFNSQEMLLTTEVKIIEALTGSVLDTCPIIWKIPKDI